MLFVCYLIEWVHSISHRKTQKNRRQRVSERWWPLPLPLPRREGAWSPRYPCELDVGCLLPLIGIYDSWNALCFLYAGGVLWVRNCAQICSVNSVSSVKDKTPHELNCALKRSVKSVCSVREKTSTKYASSSKGVTTHTTLLSIRRGIGGEAPVFSVGWRPLCGFVKPIHLCLSMRKRKQETRWEFYLSQWTQNEQIQLWTRAELIGWRVTSHVPIQLLLLIPYDP